MLVTEVTTLEFNPSSLPITAPLLNVLQHWRSRQPAYSGYPLTFYQNVLSPSTMHLLTGWRSPKDRARWLASEDYEGISNHLNPFLLQLSSMQLEMDFDTIPQIYPGIVCLVRQEEGATDMDWMKVNNQGHGTGDDAGPRSGLIWASSGALLGSNGSTICQLVLCGDALPDALQIRCGRGVIPFRRTTLSSVEGQYGRR